VIEYSYQAVRNRGEYSGTLDEVGDASGRSVYTTGFPRTDHPAPSSPAEPHTYPNPRACSGLLIVDNTT
jgi:hypothetical protein